MEDHGVSLLEATHELRQLLTPQYFRLIIAFPHCKDPLKMSEIDLIDMVDILWLVDILLICC